MSAHHRLENRAMNGLRRRVRAAAAAAAAVALAIIVTAPVAAATSSGARDSSAVAKGGSNPGDECIFLYLYCALQNCFGLQPQPASVGQGDRSKGGAIDIDAFTQLRTGLLRESVAGQRLIGLHQAHIAEVVALMAADAQLADDGVEMMQLWSTPVRVLVNGFGQELRVTEPMAFSLDGYLTDLQSTGSGALGAALLAERAQHPPVSTWVGMTMDQFADALFPTDVQFRDGMEAP